MFRKILFINSEYNQKNRFIVKKKNKMRGLVFLAILAVLAYAQDDSTSFNDPDCGRRICDIKGTTCNNKVVGGQRADPEDWGWQVAMLYNGRFTCGGSVLNKHWIITAAHCVYGRTNPNFYSFAFGLHDRTTPESWATTRSVSKVIMHPRYNPQNLQNDIALMKLSVRKLLLKIYFIFKNFN